MCTPRTGGSQSGEEEVCEDEGQEHHGHVKIVTVFCC